MHALSLSFSLSFSVHSHVSLIHAKDDVRLNLVSGLSASATSATSTASASAFTSTSTAPTTSATPASSAASAFPAVALSSLLEVLGVDDLDVVGEQVLGSVQSSLVVGKHDDDLHTQHTLSEEDVSDGVVDVLLPGSAGLDHVAVSVLLGLGSLGSELAGDHHLATLGAGLHHEPEHAVAGSSDGHTAQELVLEGLALGLGTEASVPDLLGEELDGALLEAESLLDQRGDLPDSSAALAQDLGGVGGSDNNLGVDGSDSHFHTRVAILGQLLLEELVQFGVENAISDELTLLANDSDHWKFNSEKGRGCK